jgi:hypothetical protein
MDDVDLHALLLQLFSFLPEPWKHRAMSAVSLWIAALPLLALAAYGVNKALGTPKDGDPAWKRFAFWILSRIIERAALNSQKVDDKKAQAAHASELAAKDRLIGSNLSVISSQERELQAHEAVIQRQAATIKTTLGLKGGQ